MRVTVTQPRRQEAETGGVNSNGCVYRWQGGDVVGSAVVNVSSYRTRSVNCFGVAPSPKLCPVQVNVKHLTSSSCASLFLAV
jgi:hypothetical protein